MAHRLACELPTQITAVAPIGGPGIIKNCTPSRPVPVLIIHGTDDQCALYEGGKKCGGCWQRAIAKATAFPDRGKGRFQCFSVADQTQTWRNLNHCGAGQKLTYKNGAAECYTATGCQAAPVVTCTIHGGGHTWPGAPGPKCKTKGKFCQAFIEVTGTISQDLDANQFMWDFFKRFSL